MTKAQPSATWTIEVRVKTSDAQSVTVRTCGKWIDSEDEGGEARTTVERIAVDSASLVRMLLDSPYFIGRATRQDILTSFRDGLGAQQ